MNKHKINIILFILFILFILLIGFIKFKFGNIMKNNCKPECERGRCGISDGCGGICNCDSINKDCLKSYCINSIPITPMKQQLINYYSKLYPMSHSMFSFMSEYELSDIYTNMQILYTPIIGEKWDIITKRLPNKPFQLAKGRKSYKIPNSDNQKIQYIDGKVISIPGNYRQRLFDGSVADCMRAWVPACVETSRFSASAKYEKDAFQFPGIASVVSLNYCLDLLSIGGYPDNAFVEILTYPGEYGMPLIRFLFK